MSPLVFVIQLLRHVPAPDGGIQSAEHHPRSPGLEVHIASPRHPESGAVILCLGSARGQRSHSEDYVEQARLQSGLFLMFSRKKECSQRRASSDGRAVCGWLDGRQIVISQLMPKESCRLAGFGRLHDGALPLKLGLVAEKAPSHDSGIWLGAFRRSRWCRVPVSAVRPAPRAIGATRFPLDRSQRHARTAPALCSCHP